MRGPDGIVREKPLNADEARVMLQSYAGSQASTVTGVVVTNTQTGESVSGVDICDISFASSLGEDSVIASLLQPAPAVSASSVLLHSNGRGGATNYPLLHQQLELAVPSTLEPSATQPDASRICNIYTAAGALMIEHPAMTPHIVSIKGDIDSIQGKSRRRVCVCFACML